MVLLVFHYFTGISALVGFRNPDSPFVFFDPHDGPIHPPETLGFKGKMSNIEAKLQ